MPRVETGSNDAVVAAAEREMTIHQCNLVDTCFEEGQYESGISLLDKLRHAKYKPSAAHIRQLLYIALYPPPPVLEAEDTAKSKTDNGLMFTTPSKVPPKQQRSSMAPTPVASEAAQRVLMAFAVTNSPQAVFRCLPSYDVSNVMAPTQHRDEVYDSYISRQSMRINEGKNCWEILKEAFVQRKDDSIASPKKKGRKRRCDIVEDIPFDLTGVPENPSVVGPYAWPVLDWMLTVFEKDEQLIEQSGQPRHSPLLLMQIPPHQTVTAPRWDMEAALEVVFYCMQQISPRTRSLGIRLLVLLINLAATVHVDMFMFLSAVCSRLPSLHVETFKLFWSMLPRSATVMHFKLALCKSYLLMDSSSGPSTVSPDNRRKPPARAMPRPVPARKHPTDPSAGTQEPPSRPSSTSIARKFPSFTTPELLRLLEHPVPSSDTSTIVVALHTKAELAFTFAQLQKESAGPDVEEWLNIVRNGMFAQAIYNAFDCVTRLNQDDKLAAQSTKNALLHSIVP